MCKYCKLKPGIEDEQSNDCVVIGSIKDNDQLFEVQLWRYVLPSRGINESYLILEAADRNTDGMYETRKEIRKKIKYCPFCGKKL